MSENDKRKYSLFSKTLASCVEPLIRPVLKTQGLAGTRILTEWNAIVGPALASHTQPEKLSFPPGKRAGGTLVISVESGFATELQHMQPLILEKLAVYFGYHAISRIVIANTWPAAKPKAKQTAASKAVLPKGSGAIADDVTDPELRDALKSLADTLSGSST